MSTEACSVKMYTQRQEELKDILSTSADFMPVVGSIKSVAEALTSGESWEAVRDTVNKAAKGDQKALENLAGMLTTILTPAKALTTVEKSLFWLRKVQLLPVVSLNGCRIFRRVINLMLSSLKTTRIMNCM
ncbi:hypothetical protein KE969_004819 [Escherichia coli]|nr:hypothetical protein [Escherichia coli]